MVCIPNFLLHANFKVRCICDLDFSIQIVIVFNIKSIAHITLRKCILNELQLKMKIIIHKKYISSRNEWMFSFTSASE